MGVFQVREFYLSLDINKNHLDEVEKLTDEMISLDNSLSAEIVDTNLTIDGFYSEEYAKESEFMILELLLSLESNQNKQEKLWTYQNL